MIGFGQAGGKVLEKFIQYDDTTQGQTVAVPMAINSARSDLMGLERIEEGNRILIGQTRVKGHGVGADNRLGASIAKEDMDEIQGAIDNIPVHEIDAFLIIAGLGGGTGSGGAPVLARRLKTLFSEPVYGLGILPGRDEGGIYSLNAARSFKTLVDEVDNLMMFDNDAWRKTGESVEAGYDKINDEIVKRYGVLFNAGEVDDPSVAGESIVDSSEIINTLATEGVSTIGYATSKVEKEEEGGFLSRFRRNDEKMIDASADTNRITSVVRSATLGRLTLPCDIRGAERILVLVAGPPEHLNRKGIERSRKWLEEETGCMVVRGGDYPIPNSNYVAAVALLSGVTDIPRIESLQERAQQTLDNMTARNEVSDEKLRKLVDDEGQIDRLL
jgi:cell division GTPase FtsZ